MRLLDGRNQQSASTPHRRVAGECETQNVMTLCQSLATVLRDAPFGLTAPAISGTRKPQDGKAGWSAPIRRRPLAVGCRKATIVASGTCDSLGALKGEAHFALVRVNEKSHEPFQSEREQRQLKEDLINAHEREELQVYYRPILSLTSMAVTGFEALLRWHHPTKGRINPVDFIPLAEESGLIVPIGEWVLRKACRDATKWPSTVSVSISLSISQFSSGRLVDVVRSALESSGLNADRLELEITESLLMNNVEGVLESLAELNRLGVRIAIDYFGTGFSSLNYLMRFPFDKLKIDRLFMKELRGTRNGLAILKSVMARGTNLGIRTTADGIETLEQLDVVLKGGCSEAQGYLFSSPRPIGESNSLLGIYAAAAMAAAQPQARATA